jgi:predicted AAA+ superfamily ATPase
LTSLEAEQIRPLVENVSFENEQDFTQKVQVLVEGVVSSNKPKKVLKESKKEQKALFERVVLDEETEQEEIQSLSPAMEVYSRAIERSLQN